jgi:hypothetical protein
MLNTTESLTLLAEYEEIIDINSDTVYKLIDDKLYQKYLGDLKFTRCDLTVNELLELSFKS